MKCLVEGCVAEVRARGMCLKHWTRWRRNGDPTIVRPKGGFKFAPGYEQKRGEANPRWVGDNLAYSSAHDRVRRLRGSASQHPCSHCGDAAKEWAYDHQELNELVDATTGNPYSPNPDRYVPLCKPCHARFDRANR